MTAGTPYWNFENALRVEYRQRFESDPEYAFSASRTTPEALAAKMTAGLLSGSANKDGAAIRKVCKHFGIKHTYTAIVEFLKRTE